MFFFVRKSFLENKCIKTVISSIFRSGIGIKWYFRDFSIFFEKTNETLWNLQCTRFQQNRFRLFYCNSEKNSPRKFQINFFNVILIKKKILIICWLYWHRILKIRHFIFSRAHKNEKVIYVMLPWINLKMPGIGSKTFFKLLK